MKSIRQTGQTDTQSGGAGGYQVLCRRMLEKLPREFHDPKPEEEKTSNYDVA